MKILLIQENGRHAANRAFRECYGLAWGFLELGHYPTIWGLGHDNFKHRPNFDDFDAILNLENYDQTAWLPDLSCVLRPLKLLWAIDEHCQHPDYYRSIFERDKYHVWLHATLDYCKDRNRDVWLPNAVDPWLVYPLPIPKRFEVGFCGNINNRGSWLELLKQHFDSQFDVGVLGHAMVKALNSYKVAFNRNIANDINARSFEVIACGVPLLTNFNPQYEQLGFKNEETCMFYINPGDLIEKTKWLLKNDAERSRIAKAGLKLSQNHTYVQRARQIVETIGRHRVSRIPTTIPRKTENLSAIVKRLEHKLIENAQDDDHSIDVSILTCCNRYMQRFRIYAQSVCRQDYDLSRVEVVVANPQSPDGLSSYLGLLKQSRKRPSFEEVLVDQAHFRNRGLLLHEAFKRSRGQITIGMDCDLVLPPDFLKRIVETVKENPKRIVGVYRNFLTRETTSAILAGDIDPFGSFEELKGEDQQEENGYRGVLGYCQAISRDAWNAVGYPVEFDEIAKSDVAFNERLAKIGITPMFLADLVVLHLNHERNWMGTDDFL